MAGKAAMERNLVNRCEAPSIYKGGTRLNPWIPLHSCKGIWNVKTVKAKQMKKQRRGRTGLLSSVHCWKIHVNTRDVSTCWGRRSGETPECHPKYNPCGTIPLVFICTFEDTDINDCIIRDLRFRFRSFEKTHCCFLQVQKLYLLNTVNWLTLADVTYLCFDDANSM